MLSSWLHKGIFKTKMNGFNRNYSDLFYLVYGLASFPVVLEAPSIVSVLQFVLGNPLSDIFFALRCYTCQFCVPTTQINLEPLIHIIVSS